MRVPSRGREVGPPAGHRLPRPLCEARHSVSVIVRSDQVTEGHDLPHGHRALLATAPCAPVDLGELQRRWTTACWLPKDTPLPVLLDGRYGSLRSAATAAELVRAWFVGELPRLRRSGLSLTVDVRGEEAQAILHAPDFGAVALPGWVGCSGPTDAARAISRLATRRDPARSDPGTPVDVVVREAHRQLCEEHLARSVRAVFPTDSRTCAAVEAHHAHRVAFELATASSVLWLSRLVIVAEQAGPTQEHLAWFRDACNVDWSDPHIIELWAGFRTSATRINGATLRHHLLHRAGDQAGEALRAADHLVANGDPEMWAATIAEAAAWGRLRRQDTSEGASSLA